MQRIKQLSRTSIYCPTLMLTDWIYATIASLMLTDWIYDMIASHM